MSCLLASGEPGKQLTPSSVEQLEQRPNAALDILREDLGNDAVTRFVAHYLALFEPRITEIRQSIEHGEVEAAITLLLTVETSSHMVGAYDLSRCAAALRLALGNSQADNSALLEQLAQAGASVRELLAPR